MRQYFYKTGFLLAIFTMVSILFSLCSIALVNSGRVQKIIPVLSDDYIVVYDTEKKCEKLSEYAQVFSMDDDAYTLGVKLEDDSGCALYSGDGRLEVLALEEGRVFKKEDYEKHSDVVLLREDMKVLCEEKNGKRYYHYLGIDYEVIGLYKDSQRNSVCSLRYIFNLYSRSLNESVKWTVGFFDKGKDSMSVVQKQRKTVESGFDFYQLNSKKGNIYGNVASNMRFMISLYLTVAAMVLLNVFMATNTWLRGRKKEIAVRKMVGASEFYISAWLICNFMSLVGIAFLIGVGIVKGILVCINVWEISPSMIMMFGNQLEWRGIAAAFVVIFVVGLSMIFIMQHRYLKNEIIEVVRSE